MEKAAAVIRAAFVVDGPVHPFLPGGKQEALLQERPALVQVHGPNVLEYDRWRAIVFTHDTGWLAFVGRQSTLMGAAANRL